MLGPAGPDRIDPVPLRFDFIAPHEQRLITLDQIEQQPLIGDPLGRAGEGIGHPDVERNAAQADPFAVQPGQLGHQRQADVFLGLDPDHQPVRLGTRALAGKDRMRDLAELDDDFGLAGGHPLAGAQVERHALPAPIIEMRLDRHESLGGRRLAQLFVISRDGLPGYGPGAVLAGDSLFRRDQAQRTQHLDLLIPHRSRIKVGRRLHRHQRQQLEHVVLDHIAQRARPVIEADPAFKPNRFGYRNLDMIDMRRVPQRLEQDVGEAQREQVLDGFLAQIMIDPEGSVLREGTGHRIVDLTA